MIILVINSGSSSLKYQLIDMEKETPLIKGICEKIGSPTTTIKHETFEGQVLYKDLHHIKTHKSAFNYVKDLILSDKYGAIKSFDEISAIGHRVVHGGGYFNKATFIDDQVIEKIKELADFSPLHNQVNLNSILICKEFFGDKIPQIAVFDTSFYSGLEPKAYMFALPYEYYEKYNIRKYGFHGMSHKYVSQECAKMMHKNLENTKIITCHLGSGCSLTAIDKGKAVDTTMGLTPVSGMMMGTRCGSLDPSVISFMEKKESLSLSEISNILNKKSGLLGISGVSNDSRQITQAISKGNKRAALAHEMMEYQIVKYIGAYVAVLNGCDAIVFTAGIGENQWRQRKAVCNHLEFLGVKLDEKLNQECILGVQGKISTPDSQISVFVIKTNEEIIIARETMELLNSLG